MLGRQFLVAQLIAEGSLVLAVGAELAEVGCTESPRQVQAEIEPGRDVDDGSKAAGDSLEGAPEGGKAQLSVVVQFIAV